MAHEQVAFVRYCRGFLVAVTMSTRVWMSVDACFYLIGDGNGIVADQTWTHGIKAP